MKLRIPRKRKKAYKKQMAEKLGLEPNELRYTRRNYNINIEYEEQQGH